MRKTNDNLSKLALALAVTLTAASCGGSENKPANPPAGTGGSSGKGTGGSTATGGSSGTGGSTGSDGSVPDGGAAETGDGGGDAGVSAGQKAALAAVKTYITGELEKLATAGIELQKAAPAPDADGWNNTADKPAIDAMKAQWRLARQAYEHIEGAIAVLFPELDVSTDERYDGFIADKADDNLFDGEGVTGIHAIERILWAGETRQTVIDFEKGLPNYKAAAYPKTMQEADDFKNKLCAQLVTDLNSMRDMFKPLELDPSAAYRGVIGSVAEQIEKIKFAETGEEESRYANETLADMRFNVEGGQATQKAFEPWLLETPMGAALNTKITDGFKRIADALGTGAQLPAVPATWMAANPSDTDRQTPFGKIYTVVETEADDKEPASLVSAMNSAADALGIKQLPE